MNVHMIILNMTQFLIPVGRSQFTNIFGSISHTKLFVTYLMVNKCVQHVIWVDEVLDIGY